MTGKTLTESQIDKSTTTFVDDFCNVKDSEITLIIAGLTSIIEGNESAMKKMKEQKWFQHIWYTLTGKNRAEVEDMKAKRDELSKYTIKLLVKMNQKLGDHTVLIDDLYRSLSIVRNDVNDLQDVVDDLARKLNEKINSVDHYNNIITDIQNGNFDPNKALISLIEIMSQIDRRTADDISKLDRIRQTMEKNGFDFASEINVGKHAEDVFSLPEEKVGSIYLFCQSCSNISKYLAYTCRLIENYFYCGETDRREARESGEAVNNALRWSGLRDSSNCVVSSMYNDLENAVVTQAKEADAETEIDCSSNVINQEIPGNAHTMHSIEPKKDFQKEDETTLHMRVKKTNITEVKIQATDVEEASAPQPEPKHSIKDKFLLSMATLGGFAVELGKIALGLRLTSSQMEEIRSYPDSCVETEEWLYYYKTVSYEGKRQIEVYKVKLDGTQHQQVLSGKIDSYSTISNFRIRGNVLCFKEGGTNREFKI